MPSSGRLLPALFLAADLAAGALLLLLAAPHGAFALPAGDPRLALHLLLLAAALFYTGNYRVEKADAAEEFVHLLKASALFAAALATAALFAPPGVPRPFAAILRLAALAFAALFFVRYLLRRIVHALAPLRTRLLVYGAGEMGRIFLDAAWGNPYLNYEIVGFIDDDAEKIGRTIDGVPVLGGAAQLDALVVSERIDRVVVAIPTLPRDMLVDFLFRFHRLPAGIEVIPDLYRVATTRYRLVGGVPLVSSDLALIDGANAALKRAVDLLGATLGLLVASPLLLFVALLVKLESRGPLIFSQERLGLGGKPIRVHKIRSMFVDAEERLAGLLASDPALAEEYRKYAKLRRDPRVTRVGAWIRKLSLDEFPQLWDVLRGDLSLVGPRPYLLSEREAMGEFGDTILLVKPGVTGLWQIRGRNELTFRERLRLESFYVRRWSLGLDLWILLSTIPVVLFRKGAR